MFNVIWKTYMGCLSIIIYGFTILVVLALIISFKACKEQSSSTSGTRMGAETGADTCGSDYGSSGIDATDSSDYETKIGDCTVTIDRELICKQLVVTAKNAANFRKGPGTKYDVVMTAPRGNTFGATGRIATTPKGGIWYEILIRGGEERVWASEQVVAPKE